jgi:hypothetical protein
MVQAPHVANVEQSSHSTYIQPMCLSIFARKTSTPPLKVVIPTVPSRTSTEGNSKIPFQFSLGHVRPFVINLKGKAAATRVVVVMCLFQSTLFLDVKRMTTNNINYIGRRPCPVRPLEQARHSREDWSERPIGRKAKRLMKAVGPTVEARETMTLAKIDGFESGSNDSDARLSGRNDDTIHAKVLDDSNYSKKMNDL